MSSEMFLQGTDPSSFGRVTFSISHPLAMSPQKWGKHHKTPLEAGGGHFPGAPWKVGRAGLLLTPLLLSLFLQISKI